jgi:putative transposase
MLRPYKGIWRMRPRNGATRHAVPAMDLKAEGEKRRRSIRLKDRDYGLPDVYFVTICANERRCMFGQVVEGRFAPSALGLLARECWVAIPRHFAQVALYEFVIMPNHLHGLIGIMPSLLVGAQHRCALLSEATNSGVKPGSLGAIVRSFKAIIVRRAHKELGWSGPIWQRNYFERVLRAGQELSDASRYIAENPMKWEWERENPKLKPR